jgi:hypothetical protein
MLEFIVAKKYTDHIVDGKNASIRFAQYSGAYVHLFQLFVLGNHTHIDGVDVDID